MKMKLKRTNKWKDIKAIETSLDSVNNSSWHSIRTDVWIDARDSVEASVLDFLRHFVRNSVGDPVANCIDDMDDLYRS
jgi:tRNA A37 threonylcarbamoyladenosine dehydratase